MNAPVRQAGKNLATSPSRDPLLIEDADRIEAELSRLDLYGAAQLVARMLRALRDSQQELAPYLAALEAGRSDPASSKLTHQLEVVIYLEQTVAALRVACDHKQEVIEGMQVVLNERTAEVAALKRTCDAYFQGAQDWMTRALAAEAMVAELKRVPFEAEASLRKLRNIGNLILEADDAAIQELRGLGFDADLTQPRKLTEALRAALAQPQPTDPAQSAAYAVCKGEQP